MNYNLLSMGNIDLDYYINRYFNRVFLVQYILIFIFLSFVISCVRFIGQWPVLVIVSFIVAMFVYDKLNPQQNS